MLNDPLASAKSQIRYRMRKRPTHPALPTLLDRAKMIYLYDRYSMDQIGVQLNINTENIRFALDAHGIERRAKGVPPPEAEESCPLDRRETSATVRRRTLIYVTVLRLHLERPHCPRACAYYGVCGEPRPPGQLRRKNRDCRLPVLYNVLGLRMKAQGKRDAR